VTPSANSVGILPLFIQNREMAHKMFDGRETEEQIFYVIAEEAEGDVQEKLSR